MDQALHAFVQRVAQRHKPRPPFLEIGASPGGEAVLAGNYFAALPERIAINLTDYPQADGIRFIKCNANDMRGVFSDGQFQTVISNAVMEHDRYFWKSLEEMRRVLAPGGLMIVGAPGYAKLDPSITEIVGLKLKKQATITWRVHCRPDYWRFSRQAFREVMCEGMTILELRAFGAIPRLLAVARKPAVVA